MKRISLYTASIALVFLASLVQTGEVSYALEPTSSQITPPAITIVEEQTVTKGTVQASRLNVRENPGTNYAIIGKLANRTQITILEIQNDWYKIQYEQLVGWVHKDYVINIESKKESEWKAAEVSRGSLTARSALPQAASETVSQVLAYANTFLGTPYKYGASGPKAFDCSGFVRYVLAASGIDVPRSSKDYKTVGVSIALQDVAAGDIVCFDTSGKIDGIISHVGIYVGNGEFIHAASGSSKKVRMSSLYDDYHSKRLVRICRII